MPHVGDCNNSCNNCINKQQCRELLINEEIRKSVQCLQFISLVQREQSVDLLIRTFLAQKQKLFQILDCI